eukprot:SAG11_NODE_396_length_9806_cov_37.601855_5_plen_102_part_00
MADRRAVGPVRLFRRATLLCKLIAPAPNIVGLRVVSDALRNAPVVARLGVEADAREVCPVPPACNNVNGLAWPQLPPLYLLRHGEHAESGTTDVYQLAAVS